MHYKHNNILSLKKRLMTSKPLTFLNVQLASNTDMSCCKTEQRMWSTRFLGGERSLGVVCVVPSSLSNLWMSLAFNYIWESSVDYLFVEWFPALEWDHRGWVLIYDPVWLHMKWCPEHITVLLTVIYQRCVFLLCFLILFFYILFCFKSLFYDEKIDLSCCWVGVNRNTLVSIANNHQLWRRHWGVFMVLHKDHQKEISGYFFKLCYLCFFAIVCKALFLS